MTKQLEENPWQYVNKNTLTIVLKDVMNQIQEGELFIKNYNKDSTIEKWKAKDKWTANKILLKTFKPAFKFYLSGNIYDKDILCFYNKRY